jgi:hypothetical protein
MGEMRSGQARANGCRVADVIERTMIERAMIEPAMGALAVDRGMECRSARVTDLRGRMRIEAPGVEPAAGQMRRTVSHRTRAAHVNGAHVRGAAHTDTAAAEVCGAAAKVHPAAATPEMGTAAATAEVSATATAPAEMCTPTATPAPAQTAGVRRFGRGRQTKGKGYCGRARRDFPHDMTSSSGQMRKINARSPGPVPAGRTTMLQCTHI